VSVARNAELLLQIRPDPGIRAHRATANRATANRATANRATANRATANRATANRATANGGLANRALANRALANRATANQQHHQPPGPDPVAERPHIGAEDRDEQLLGLELLTGRPRSRCKRRGPAHCSLLTAHCSLLTARATARTEAQPQRTPS
jgi:hypothetical protein